MLRTVLLHYHLFKNAGTSLDEVLKRNFGANWVTREFERRRPIQTHKQNLAQWILDNPTAVAFSSHTIEAPPPELPGIRIIPLIFLRHPIDRIASAYAFERRQSSEGFGAVLARNTTLPGYVEVRLSIPSDKQCRNFHTDRLVSMASKESAPDENSMLECARTVLPTLPFIGIVEDFSGSMERLGTLLTPDFPNFKPQTVAANVSREHSLSLELKLAKLQTELGSDLYRKLEEANASDLVIYQLATSLITASKPANSTPPDNTPDTEAMPAEVQTQTAGQAKSTDTLPPTKISD